MTSATSRSLPEIPEVLYHIFSYLDPIHQSDDNCVYESRRSLALAARTCRGFTSPALDVLWKRLPDDQPLADLLCHLGIVARDGVPSHVEVPGETKPGRYQLPYQDGGYWGFVDPYEARWRLSRGYDLRYVSFFRLLQGTNRAYNLLLLSFCASPTILAHTLTGPDS